MFELAYGQMYAPSLLLSRFFLFLYYLSFLRKQEFIRSEGSDTDGFLLSQE